MNNVLPMMSNRERQLIDRHHVHFTMNGRILFRHVTKEDVTIGHTITIVNEFGDRFRCRVLAVDGEYVVGVLTV